MNPQAIQTNNVVAIKEIENVKTRFYFELKGGSDRNIDDSVLTKRDGVIESLTAAKNTPYIEKGIPGLSMSLSIMEF